MRGYLIHNGELTDPEGYEEYKAKAEKVVAAFDGRYLVRGGPSERLEGTWHPRFVIVEFPSYEAAQRFYHSPAYQGISHIGRRASVSATAVAEGIAAA